MSPCHPFIVLAGPTASGKSALAVTLAEHLGNVEIVGADAFQIYAGLPLLTAKPSPDELARIPHHLIGEIPLSQPFDVAQYLALATARLAEIRARGKTPLIVGGTGLYLRALIRGLADLPPADPTLRAELELLPLAELQSRLAALDPVAVQTLDLQNPRRVIRALEVCLLTGLPFSSFRQQWTTVEGEPPLPPLGLWLDREPTDLHTRINQRVENIFRENAVLDEVRTTLEPGPTAAQTLGLREIQSHLRGELPLAETISRIQQSTRQYAKRQRTWLRREPQLQRLLLPSHESADLTPLLNALQLALRQIPVS